MNRCQPYRPMNPLTGIWPACGNAPGYRYASPDGDASPTIVHGWTFTFSAKEKDSETGLSYFGSRYYSSDLSIWLSVDPQASKYPSLSPYVYCADNPVKLVDPEGELYRKFENYDNGSFLGEIDDGVDETVRITASHYRQLQDCYNTDKQINDDNLTSYNEMIDRYSIGKVGYSIAQTALKYEGSYAWAYDVKKDNFPKNSYKCNKFVYDVLSENGVEPPGEWPPQASAWAGNGCIKGWEKVSQPNVGDIVAGAYNYSDASGHVVIVTGINLSTGEISVMGTVNSSYIGDNGFGNNMVNNNGWHDGKHYSPGIRRFVGKQQ